MDKKVRMVGNQLYTDVYSEVIKIFRFKVFSASGKNVCFKCGQQIRNYKDMTMDHKIPWRNKPREEALKLLMDIYNIAWSHPQCNNINETIKAKSGYLGVYFHKNAKDKKWQARIRSKNKCYSLGYWKTTEQAAMKRDLFAMKLYNGEIILNFPQLRDFYNKNLNNDWSFLKNEAEVQRLLGA